MEHKEVADHRNWRACSLPANERVGLRGDEKNIEDSLVRWAFSRMLEEANEIGYNTVSFCDGFSAERTS